MQIFGSCVFVRISSKVDENCYTPLVRRFAKPSVFLYVLLLICLPNTSAEPCGTTTCLTGVVLDQMGAVIPDASIILLSSDKMRQTKTKNDGAFEFVGLPPGNYDVRVTHLGFKPQAVADVKITSGQIRRVEITLQVGPGACDAEPVVTYEARVGSVSMVGDVRDFWEGSLRGATIILISLKTGYERVTTSSADGTFQFSDLEPGKYKLQLTHVGYHGNSGPEFWITRENLTRITELFIFKLNETRVIVCQ